MSIIRREKTDNYSIIHNECFRDSKLSARAKGIFAYIMSLPDDWKLYKSELQAHFSEGRDAINTAFMELERAGYIDKKPIQGEGGRLGGWDYTVHETTESLETRNTVSPIIGKPATTKDLSKPTTEKTKEVVASAPSPAAEIEKKRIQSKALLLSKELLRRVSETSGRKLVSRPTGKSIAKLLKAGVTEGAITDTIEWCVTANLKRDYPFAVQSESSLYKKWDNIQGAMSAKPKAEYGKSSTAGMM